MILKKMKTKEDIDRLTTLCRIMRKASTDKAHTDTERLGYATEAIRLKKMIDGRLNPNDMYVR